MPPQRCHLAAPSSKAFDDLAIQAEGKGWFGTIVRASDWIAWAIGLCRHGVMVTAAPARNNDLDTSYMVEVDSAI